MSRTPKKASVPIVLIEGPPPKAKPQCPICGVGLKSFSNPNRDPIQAILTADGEAPARGGAGDNLVCTVACGRILAVLLVRCIPGVLDLLPETLRADLRPPPTEPDGPSQGLIPAHVAARRRVERTKL